MHFFTLTTFLAAAASASAAALTGATPRICRQWYQTQPGDSCWSIGKQNNIEPFRIQQSNPQINCGNLSIGQSICLRPRRIKPSTPLPRTYQCARSTTDSNPTHPGAAATTCTCSKWHIILPDDSCWSIGQEFNVEPFRIQQSNPEINCNNLSIGQLICLSPEPIEPSPPNAGSVPV